MGQLIFTPCKGYEKFLPRWTKMADVVGGGPELKERDLNNNGTYLRQLNPADKSMYNAWRNRMYINGAVFYNATARTVQGLMGMVFRVDPTIPDVPKELEYLMDDVDGSGLTLIQQSKAVTRAVIIKGRDGLLVDLPTLEDGTQITRYDIENGVAPRIVRYAAESIIDWDEVTVNGKRQLCYVALSECICERDTSPPFCQTETVRTRVLRLVGGEYWQTIYSEDGEEQSRVIIGADGKPLKYIPFAFVGSENNSPDIDSIPLEAIADVNIGHYRNSADLESSSFQLSAAQPWIADDKYAQAHKRAAEDGADNTVILGEESIFILGSGGSYNLTAPPPNTLASTLADDKVELMITLGAQLISPGGAAETAEAVRIKKSSDASVLSLITENVSEAYTMCIYWCGLFLGVDIGDERFLLNSEFFDEKITPDEQRALVEGWQSGLYPRRIVLERLQKAKMIMLDEDIESIAEEADEEGALDLDEPVQQVEVIDDQSPTV